MHENLPKFAKQGLFLWYNILMIKKVLKITCLKDPSNVDEDLKYWLKQPDKDRLAAVDTLRNQVYGHTARLQRVARVIQRPSR